MLVVGLLWPRLTLGVAASWVAFALFIYGVIAILAAHVIAASWDVGIETISLMGELPHSLSRGSAFQEAVIRVVAFSSAPTGVARFVLILWGLRRTDSRIDG